MMSVGEFFYGNQATPAQIMTPAPVKQQQHAPQGSKYTFFSHAATLPRDDHAAAPPSHSRNYANYSNYSNLDSNSGYQQQQESQVLLDSRYPSSTHVSSAALQYENASVGVNTRRQNLSKDNFSSPSYSRHSSRGGNSMPGSTWVELRVPICCEGCEDRVTSHLLDLPGVEAVRCDKMKQKVVVRGTAAAADVLRLCRKLFKRSEFWRYQYDWK